MSDERQVLIIAATSEPIDYGVEVAVRGKLKDLVNGQPALLSHAKDVGCLARTKMGTGPNFVENRPDSTKRIRLDLHLANAVLAQRSIHVDDRGVRRLLGNSMA